MNHKRFAIARDQCVHPRGFQPAALLRDLAAEKILGHTESDKADGRFEQRSLDLLALAGSLACRDSRKDAIAAVDSGEMIRKRGARALGLFEIGENAQQPAQRLA